MRCTGADRGIEHEWDDIGFPRSKPIPASFLGTTAAVTRSPDRTGRNPARPRVDFDLDGSAAIAIHAELDPASLVSSEVVATPQNAKSKIVAGLLAIFLGGLGIHKFCLGYHGAGILFLALRLVAFISACTIIGALVAIPLGMVIGIIALIEGIISLTKFDEDFHQTYVVKQRMFF